MWWTVPAPSSELPMVIVAIESHQGAIDMQVTTIGLDIAKNVFQVHGIDAAKMSGVGSEADIARTSRI